MKAFKNFSTKKREPVNGKTGERMTPTGSIAVNRKTAYLMGRESQPILLEQPTVEAGKKAFIMGRGSSNPCTRPPSRDSFMRAKNTVTSSSRILQATAFQELFRTTAGMVRESRFSLTDRASKGFGKKDGWWKNLSSVTQGFFSS